MCVHIYVYCMHVYAIHICMDNIHISDVYDSDGSRLRFKVAGSDQQLDPRGRRRPIPPRKYRSTSQHLASFQRSARIHSVSMMRSAVMSMKGGTWADGGYLYNMYLHSAWFLYLGISRGLLHIYIYMKSQRPILVYGLYIYTYMHISIYIYITRAYIYKYTYTHILGIYIYICILGFHSTG